MTLRSILKKSLPLVLCAGLCSQLSSPAQATDLPKSGFSLFSGGGEKNAHMGFGLHRGFVQAKNLLFGPETSFLYDKSSYQLMYGLRAEYVFSDVVFSASLGQAKVIVHNPQELNRVADIKSLSATSPFVSFAVAQYLPSNAQLKFRVFQYILPERLTTLQYPDKRYSVGVELRF